MNGAEERPCQRNRRADRTPGRRRAGAAPKPSVETRTARDDGYALTTIALPRLVPPTPAAALASAAPLAGKRQVNRTRQYLNCRVGASQRKIVVFFSVSIGILCKVFGIRPYLGCLRGRSMAYTSRRRTRTRFDVAARIPRQAATRDP